MRDNLAATIFRHIAKGRFRYQILLNNNLKNIIPHFLLVKSISYHYFFFNSKHLLYAIIVFLNIANIQCSFSMRSFAVRSIHA
jgi:hypothetical protein